MIKRAEKSHVQFHRIVQRAGHHPDFSRQKPLRFQHSGPARCPPRFGRHCSPDKRAAPRDAAGMRLAVQQQGHRRLRGIHGFQIAHVQNEPPGNVPGCHPFQFGTVIPPGLNAPNMNRGQGIILGMIDRRIERGHRRQINQPAQRHRVPLRHARIGPVGGEQRHSRLQQRLQMPLKLGGNRIPGIVGKRQGVRPARHEPIQPFAQMPGGKHNGILRQHGRQLLNHGPGLRHLVQRPLRFHLQDPPPGKQRRQRQDSPPQLPARLRPPGRQRLQGGVYSIPRHQGQKQHHSVEIPDNKNPIKGIKYPVHNHSR